MKYPIHHNIVSLMASLIVRTGQFKFTQKTQNPEYRINHSTANAVQVKKKKMHETQNNSNISPQVKYLKIMNIKLFTPTLKGSENIYAKKSELGIYIPYCTVYLCDNYHLNKKFLN